MSNRKENIKKSLGITEYPWSSDDEENEEPSIPNLHILQNSYDRQVDESRTSVSSLPGTSGTNQPQPPAPPPAPSCPNAARRNQAKIDRDAFWSLINSHKQMASASGVNRSGFRVKTSQLPFSRTVAHVPAAELRTSSDRANSVVEINRMIAIKQLTRSLGGLRSANAGPNINTPTGQAVPPRNTCISNPPEDLATVHCSYNHMRPKRHGHSSFAPVRHSSTSRDPQPGSSGESRAAPPLVDHSEEDNELNRLREENEANEIIEGRGNSSGETMEVSMEEEIVEIEPEPEAAAVPDGELVPPAGAPDGNTDDNNIENPENPAIESNIDEQQRRHGVKRKREGNDDSSDVASEPGTVRELNTSLLRLLECPVCLEWMEPPMCQCRRGHLVCGRCRARLASCPVCRTAFSSLRNRAMEGVAEILRYPCRHGCGREVRLRRRGPHEASCAARRYPCPAPACAARPPLPLHDLHKHAQTKHPAMVKMGRKHKISVRLSSEQHDNWVVVALHELFHLRLDVLRPFGVVVYVSYIGPKKNAHNFIYEVTVTGQHNSRKLIYARATHSDLESSSLNVSRQDCFYLTLDQALNFLRVKNRHSEADNSLDFNIEITKSESTDENKEDSDS